MLKRVPGTKDILPQEAGLWLHIEEQSRNIFNLYNYHEIRLPLLEDAALFNRTLGASADIVQKQMFVIKKEDASYAMRPEGTASVVRAYIENNLDKTNGFIKLFYIGPMFRYERPQRGRLRQFHHIGCETIGSYDPFLDAEVISLGDKLLKSAGVTGYKIHINSLGCANDRKKLADYLRKEIKGKLDKLCADCRKRFDVNILRILDCKNEECKSVLKGLSLGGSHICPDCDTHFKKLKGSLSVLGIKFEVNPFLVRGLDYYTRTVFEFRHDALGAQDALGAGGRYDDLVKNLGGPDVGSVGLALGVERMILALGRQEEQITNKLVYIIALGEKARDKAVEILGFLRANNIACDTDYENKTLKAAMRVANNLNAKFALIIGEDELKAGVLTLKDMANSQQISIKESQLLNEFKARMN
ncbi:MAG: histidine--tRNA ligase [Candidatus Omnitrophota bacterium]|jgi:histidyl-tRNA synthetase|nr:MAG: histidine--tRNA ligase [Candidatus Omnitrophota bacterium]